MDSLPLEVWGTLFLHSNNKDSLTGQALLIFFSFCILTDELIHLQSPRSASSSSFQDDTYERESFPDSERVG